MMFQTVFALLLALASVQTTTGFVAGGSQRHLAAFVCTARTSSASATPLHSFNVDSMSEEDMRSLFLDGIDQSELDFDSSERDGDDKMDPLIALTEDNAIKINGVFSDTESEADPLDLKRYTQMHELSEEQVQTLFAHTNAKIIAKGVGEEWYELPPKGKTTATTEYSAEDAVKEALKVAESADGAPRIVFNIFGGDDLVFVEVTDALENLVKKLKGIPEGATILFNSMAYEIVEEETCWLTVVAMNDIEGNLPDDLTGPLRNAAEGEVYFARGKYWTTSEDDTVTEKDYNATWWDVNVENPSEEMLEKLRSRQPIDEAPDMEEGGLIGDYGG